MRILAAALVLGLAPQANAEEKPFSVGDVFFCRTEVNVAWQWSDNKLVNYAKEKFKFSIVDPKIIIFKGGHLHTYKMEISSLTNFSISATSASSKMSIDNRKFNLASSTFASAEMIAAICDRF